MTRPINFGAGPAVLPQEVLQQAAEAVLNYEATGLSILEIAHRGTLFLQLLEEANSLVLELLELDADYKVMWMQGGGRLQFAMLPMNFSSKVAGYIDSGHWATAALNQAALYGATEVIASSKADQYRQVPQIETIPGSFDYVHLTTNNTICGTQLFQVPESIAPLIADMSSDIFSRQLDFKRFGLIYAVAQKNIGAAGVTLVVAHKSMLERQVRAVPAILSYKEMAAQNSLVNTPPVFAIYTCLLTLRWIKQQGLVTLEEKNEEKARLLYKAIDDSKLFYGVAEVGSRSKMNVCFRLHQEGDTQRFIDYCRQQYQITGIDGHRSVGGFRASIYNAVSKEDVLQLVQAINHFS